MKNFLKKLLSSKGLVIVPKLNYQVDIQKTDTFLVSYPKSGNTWARFLIANLISEKPFSFSDIRSIIPDIHDFKSLKYLRPNENRILKSHFAFQPKYKKVIYIVRDPRSVCVSQYFFKQRRYELDKDATFSMYFKSFLNGFEDGYGSWGENVQSWIAVKEKNPNFLLVKYEDLKQNTLHEVMRIVAFLNLDISLEIVQKAIENSSMDKMRKLENDDRQINKRKPINQSIPFVRKGSTNEWKEFLTKEMEKELIDAFYLPMKKLNYI